MRIDKVDVPASWLITAISTTFFVAVSGTFYVSRVNTRLERIELKLGIAQVETPLAITQANADTLEPKPVHGPKGDIAWQRK